MSYDDHQRYEKEVAEANKVQQQYMLLGGIGFLILLMIYGVIVLANKPTMTGPKIGTYMLAVTSGFIMIAFLNLHLTRNEEEERPNAKRNSLIAASSMVVFFLIYLFI